MASGGVVGLEPQLLLAKSLRKEIDCKKSRVSLPLVCMNNNGYVVVFYEYDNHIYWVVGKINHGTENQPQLKIDWGLENDYGDGCKVQACLTDNNVLVLVRERKWVRECVYSIGTVGKSLAIVWNKRDEFLCKGITPTVAVMGNAVLCLHEGAVFNTMHYNVFELKDLTLNAKGQTDSLLPSLNGYTEVSLAGNSGDVVIVGRSNFSKSLHYAVGKLDNFCLSGLTSVKHYSHGSLPRVCLLEDGKVVEVHESIVGTSLYYKSGNFQPDQGDIAWQESRDCGNGYYPSIAVNDHPTVVMFYTALKVCSQLLYRLGTGL